jgi:hypothetical protein
MSMRSIKVRKRIIITCTFSFTKVKKINNGMKHMLKAYLRSSLWIDYQSPISLRKDFIGYFAASYQHVPLGISRKSNG